MRFRRLNIVAALVMAIILTICVCVAFARLFLFPAQPEKHHSALHNFNYYSAADSAPLVSSGAYSGPRITGELRAPEAIPGPRRLGRDCRPAVLV